MAWLVNKPKLGVGMPCQLHPCLRTTISLHPRRQTVPSPKTFVWRFASHKLMQRRLMCQFEEPLEWIAINSLASQASCQDGKPHSTTTCCNSATGILTRCPQGNQTQTAKFLDGTTHRQMRHRLMGVPVEWLSHACNLWTAQATPSPMLPEANEDPPSDNVAHVQTHKERESEDTPLRRRQEGQVRRRRRQKTPVLTKISHCPSGKPTSHTLQGLISIPHHAETCTA